MRWSLPCRLCNLFLLVFLPGSDPTQPEGVGHVTQGGPCQLWVLSVTVGIFKSVWWPRPFIFPLFSDGALSSGTDLPTNFSGDIQSDSPPLIVKWRLHIVVRRRKWARACHRKEHGSAVKNPDPSSLAAHSVTVIFEPHISPQEASAPSSLKYR